MAYTNTVTDFMVVTEKSLQCDIWNWMWLIRSRWTYL